MFAVTRLRAGDGDDAALAAAATRLLAALSARPGFRDGELGRSADDPSLWALVTRWDGVGTYRRALSAAEALAHGLVTRLVPAEALEAMLEEIAATIAKAPPAALR